MWLGEGAPLLPVSSSLLPQWEALLGTKVEQSTPVGILLQRDPSLSSQKSRECFLPWIPGSLYVCVNKLSCLLKLNVPDSQLEEPWLVLVLGLCPGSSGTKPHQE